VASISIQAKSESQLPGLTKRRVIEWELVTRAVKASDPEGASLVLRSIVQDMRDLMTDVDHTDVLDALKRLVSSKAISLSKWDGYNTTFRSYRGDNDDHAFFATGNFRVKGTVSSRPYLDEIASGSKSYRVRGAAATLGAD
jgi:hypothetical protein